MLSGALVGLGTTCIRRFPESSLPVRVRDFSEGRGAPLERMPEAAARGCVRESVLRLAGRSDPAEAAWFPTRKK